MAVTPNPFGPQHRQQLDDALRHIYDARQLMGAAENCGVDCAQHRAMADQMEEFLNGIKTNFFSSPGQAGQKAG